MMEQNFKEVMSKKSTNELLDILKIKGDYQPLAIEAVEEELRTRNTLLESNNINIDDADDFDYLKKVKSLENAELINIFRNKYVNLSQVEASILNNELATRKIEPQLWYYAKNEQKNGPYTTTEFKEFARQGKIDFYDYIWREGLIEWIEANKVEGLFGTNKFPPRLSSSKPSWIQSKKHLTAGIIFASVVMFFTSLVWLLIGFFQAAYSSYANDFFTGYLGFWNVFGAATSIAFGIGCLKLKRWGYTWGLVSSIGNFLWFGYLFMFQNASLFNVFMIATELATSIILFSNRKQFAIESPIKIGI
jgi:hypothetical protein